MRMTMPHYCKIPLMGETLQPRWRQRNNHMKWVEMKSPLFRTGNDCIWMMGQLFDLRHDYRDALTKTLLGWNQFDSGLMRCANAGNIEKLTMSATISNDWDWINPRFESRDGISAILPKLSEVNLHGEFLIEARGMSKLATYYVPLGLTKPSCILLFPNRQQMDRQRENDKLVFSSCTDRVERRAAGSNQTNKTQIQWS